MGAASGLVLGALLLVGCATGVPRTTMTEDAQKGHPAVFARPNTTMGERLEDRKLCEVTERQDSNLAKDLWDTTTFLNFGPGDPVPLSGLGRYRETTTLNVQCVNDKGYTQGVDDDHLSVRTRDEHPRPRSPVRMHLREGSDCVPSSSDPGRTGLLAAAGDRGGSGRHSGTQPILGLQDEMGRAGVRAPEP